MIDQSSQRSISPGASNTTRDTAWPMPSALGAIHPKPSPTATASPAGAGANPGTVAQERVIV